MVRERCDRGCRRHAAWFYVSELGGTVFLCGVCICHVTDLTRWRLLDPSAVQAADPDRHVHDWRTSVFSTRCASCGVKKPS